MRFHNILMAVLLQTSTLHISALEIGTSKGTQDSTLNMSNTNPSITQPNSETSTLESTTMTSIITKPPSEILVKVPTGISTTIIQHHEEVGKNKGSSKNEYCQCNLNLNSCDVNCCCDADCPENILKVFDCKREISNIQHLEDYQFEHGLPPCSINDGWLCVFRNNKKSENSEDTNFILDTRDMYKWPDILQMTDYSMNEPNIADFYKFNEPLILINPMTKDITNIEIPFSFIITDCNIKIPLTHLKSRQYACPYTNMEKLYNNRQEIIQLAERTKILSTPKSQELLSTLKDDDIKPFLVDITLQNCFNSAEEEQSLCVELNTFDNDTESEKEQFYTSEIIFKIYHNYTNILDGTVVFIERELLDIQNEESCFEIWQTFKVDFIAKLEVASNLATPKKSAKKLSGPLGYLLGEPVIVARIAESNSSNMHSVLDYFDNKSSKNTISILTRRQNNCYKDDKTKISFGMNEQKTCFLKLKNDTDVFISDTSQLNYTAVCLSLQRLVWAHLFNLEKIDNTHSLWMHLNILQISKLGRPQNQTDKWLPLQILNFENAPTLVSHDERKHTFMCHNMLLSASFEFHIGHFWEQGLPQQGIIQHGNIIMGNLHDLEFSIDGDIEIPLTVSVMFYDIMMKSSAPNVKIYFTRVFCIIFIKYFLMNYLN